MHRQNPHREKYFRGFLRFPGGAGTWPSLSGDSGKITALMWVGFIGEHWIVFSRVEMLEKTPPRSGPRRRARGTCECPGHVPTTQGLGKNKIVKFGQDPSVGNGRSGSFFSSTKPIPKTTVNRPLEWLYGCSVVLGVSPSGRGTRQK